MGHQRLAKLAVDTNQLSEDLWGSSGRDGWIKKNNKAEEFINLHHEVTMITINL